MEIPRAERLRVIQRVHVKWTEIHDDRDDFEANAVHFQMMEDAMGEAEEKFKDRSADS